MVCVQAQEGLQFLYQELASQLKDVGPVTDLLSALTYALEYEYLVPQRYCEVHNVALKRIGYPDLPLHACIELAKNFHFESRLFRLYEEYGTSTFDAHKKAISALYYEHASPLFSEIQLYDGYVEQHLRKQRGDVVYIGSYGNIFGAYHNLYERFRDIGAKRIRLCEADLMMQ